MSGAPAAPVDTDALAAEMLAGLEGVTPGEWAINERHSNKIVWMPPGWWPLCETIHERDAAHIHATRPTAIRALLAERDAMKAEIERLREALAWAERQRLDAIERAKLVKAPEDYEIGCMCERYGYGAVMDSASRQWIKKDPIGAFFIGGCVGETSARAALKGADHD